jgi:zinc transport system substrate-binding protein
MLLLSMNKIIIILVIIIVAYGFFSLSSRETTKTQNQKPSVSATIFPLYDIVKNVAGNDIDVFLILPPGASPHTFEPTPSTLKKTENTKIVFSIGYGLDDWAFDLVSDKNKVKKVDDGIELRASVDEEEGTTDPHYFLTGQNAILISQTVAESLKSIFPEFADSISQNQKLYQTELEKMDEQIKTELSSVKKRDLITFHDAWYYFADAYELNIAGTFEPTVGREPTPQYLAELSKKIDETKVKILYAEPQFSARGMEAFLKDHKISIATIDPEGGGDESTSFINIMLYNARTISKNQ